MNKYNVYLNTNDYISEYDHFLKKEKRYLNILSYLTENKDELINSWSTVKKEIAQDKEIEYAIKQVHPHK